MSTLLQPHEADWYEASARERVVGLLDPKSFVEFLGPEQRVMSPHLVQFDLTGAFDDGIVVRSSVGVGLIWASPFGPLRFDYAVPITKGAHDVVQQFKFGGGTSF